MGALDPSTLLFLIDGKHVEHAFWRERADALVGPNVPDAIDVLRMVVAEKRAKRPGTPR